MNKPVIHTKSPCTIELEPGVYLWCRCGRSAIQPFCDDSHFGTGIEPLAFDLKETETVELCQCKQTSTPPFCDGTHESLG